MSFHHWVARDLARDRVERLVREADRWRIRREARALHRRRRIPWGSRWTLGRAGATVPQPRREDGTV